jgi:hypothetical protein
VKVGLALGLPLAALIAAPIAGASSPPPPPLPPTVTSIPADIFPPPTGGVPLDWTPLEDETRTIRIAVPATWTAVDVAARQNGDGTPLPWISATTDAATFFPAAGATDTFGVPGVLYRATPFDPDTAAPLAASTFHSVCTAGPLQRYDDGVFAGHLQSFDSCGGTTSRVVRVIANPADQAFTADLLVQLTGQPDDAATLNGLLLSFLSVS